MRFSYIVDKIFQIYILMIVARCFLSWFQNSIDTNKPFIKFLTSAVDVYLSPFQRVIPSLNGLDFSPIVAIIFLQLAQSIISSALFRMGF